MVGDGKRHTSSSSTPSSSSSSSPSQYLTKHLHAALEPGAPLLQTSDPGDPGSLVPLEDLTRARHDPAPTNSPPPLLRRISTAAGSSQPRRSSLEPKSDENTLPLESDLDAEHDRDSIDSNTSSVRLTRDGAMPPKPSLLSSGRTPSYGAVSQTPSGNVSPTDTDSDPDDARPLRRISGSGTGTTRSTNSKRSHSSLARVPSRISEDLDASTIATGPDGRFGVAQSTLPSDALQDVKSDSTEESDEEGGQIFRRRGGRRNRTADGSASDTDETPVEDSPYDSVRASVTPTDNITLSVSTPRMWVLSVMFSILGSSTNLFFSLRYPSVSITPVIALLLVHPLGRMWDLLLKRPDDPEVEFFNGVRATTPTQDPRRSPGVWNRLRLWLAQGRWNEKEHTCVYVSSNVSFGFAFATDVIVEQSKFYNQEATITYQLLLTLSTQILGYAFAGITRRFLVRPAGMMWPGTLMSAAMFGTLHREENKTANGWRISRWNFFYVIFISAFLFYFLPGLLMPCLSYFNVLTWFAPKSVVVSSLFGVSSGLGLFPITFDWAQVTYIGSPLLVPFWASMNVIGGMFVVMWLIAPIAYYANLYYSSYMPILSTAIFDNTGSVYDVSKILTPDFLFDKQAYSEYSRVFLPITYVLSYGVQFAGLAALLTHTACWHGKDMWETWRRAWQDVRDEGKATAYQPLSNGTDATAPNSPAGPRFSDHASGEEDNHMFQEDVHCRLMRRYPDAPLWWYLTTFVSMLAIGMFIVEYYPIHLPWYGLLLALGICAIFFIPNGIIMAVTNQHSSTYLICQLICGAVFPGRPVANMIFTTYGYISSAQGIKFASDLKLGHYMKIPPRIMFSVQMAATVVSSITQIGVLNWMFANVPGLCTSEAVNGFTCPLARVHFNGSILWGVVGPGKFFGPDAMYHNLVWFFLLGAVLPIPLWLWATSQRGRWTRSGNFVRKINLPLLFGTMSWIPPATGLNFSVWVLVCYAFNYRIKRQAKAWWAKYTMTLSAALDSSLALGIVVVFFGFVYSGLTKNFSWWGTEVYKQGCDWQACPYQTVPEGEHFGPDTW